MEKRDFQKNFAVGTVIAAVVGFIVLYVVPYFISLYDKWMESKSALEIVRNRSNSEIEELERLLAEAREAKAASNSTKDVNSSVSPFTLKMPTHKSKLQEQIRKPNRSSSAGDQPQRNKRAVESTKRVGLSIQENAPNFNLRNNNLDNSYLSNRQLREQQDREYLECLELDKAIQLSKEAEKRRLQERSEKRILLRSSQMPEPEDDGSNEFVLLSFRYINQDDSSSSLLLSCKRRFLKTNTIQEVLGFAEANDLLGEQYNVKAVTLAYPKTELTSESSKSLKECGITGQSLIWVTVVLEPGML